MTATDELRRLLDERNVEYKERDMYTRRVFHWGEPLHGAMFSVSDEWTELVVENPTPEQAVDATLGRGECGLEEGGWTTEGDHARVWLTCGHSCMVGTVADLPKFCPECGKQVKVKR